MNSSGQRGSAPRLVLTSFLAFLCLVIGCGKSNRPEEAASPPKQKTSEATPTLNMLPPGYSTEVSKQEALAFAEQLENAVATNDSTAANRLFDWNLFLDRALKGLPLPEGRLRELHSSLRDEFAGSGSAGKRFFQQILTEVARGGSYRFVRLEKEDGVRRVLFRSVFEDNLNYLRYPLVRIPSGKVAASDMYSYATARHTSEELGDIAINMVTDASESSSGSGWGPPAWIKTTAAIRKARKEGRFEDSLRLYRELPDSVRFTRARMIGMVTTAHQVSEEACLAAVEEYVRRFANDGSLALVMIAYHSLRKEYKEALDAVDSLDAEVHDPYLNLFRANLHYVQKDLAATRKSIDHFVTDLPEFIDGHDIRLTVAMEQGDFSAVTETLKVCHSDFDIDPEFVLEDPFYAPYKKSDEYKILMKYLKEQTP